MDSKRFREVFGHLPTGVAIVAAETADGPVGMAVNALTSVSLEPPMMLVCPAVSSTTWPLIREHGSFCVNIIGAAHGEMSRRFAKTGADRFDGVSWEPRRGGPAIEGAVAWIDCELREEHPAGDHTIAVATVLDLEARSDRAPLVFHRGAFGGFLPA